MVLFHLKSKLFELLRNHLRAAHADLALDVLRRLLQLEEARLDLLENIEAVISAFVEYDLLEGLDLIAQLLISATDSADLLPDFQDLVEHSLGLLTDDLSHLRYEIEPNELEGAKALRKMLEVNLLVLFIQLLKQK